MRSVSGSPASHRRQVRDNHGFSDGSQGSKYRFAHVGIAVADLEKAVEFYKVFLQAEPVLFWDSNRKQFIDELVGYEANMKEVLFELQDGYLELLEYTEPKPGVTDPETYNVGHMHFAWRSTTSLLSTSACVTPISGSSSAATARSRSQTTSPTSRASVPLSPDTRRRATFELFERAPGAVNADAATRRRQSSQRRAEIATYAMSSAAEVDAALDPRDRRAQRRWRSSTMESRRTLHVLGGSADGLDTAAGPFVPVWKDLPRARCRRTTGSSVVPLSAEEQPSAPSLRQAQFVIRDDTWTWPPT